MKKRWNRDTYCQRLHLLHGKTHGERGGRRRRLAGVRERASQKGRQTGSIKLMLGNEIHSRTNTVVTVTLSDSISAL